MNISPPENTTNLELHDKHGIPDTESIEALITPKDKDTAEVTGSEINKDMVLDIILFTSKHLDAMKAKYPRKDMASIQERDVDVIKATKLKKSLHLSNNTYFLDDVEGRYTR